jgi:hypothetical protein
MATVYRVRAVWSGFAGAPGYSNFSFSDLTTDAARNAAGAAVKGLFTGIAANLSPNWTITVQPEVTEWDVATGQLTGASAMTTPPTPQTGTGTAVAYAGGSGACITWKTSVIFNGRRVTGRTFMVPLVGAFEVDGTLSGATLAAFTSSANAFVATAGADVAVWAKQMTKPTDGSKPVQIGGTVASVTSIAVKDMASQLRSRRL